MSSDHSEEMELFLDGGRGKSSSTVHERLATPLASPVPPPGLLTSKPALEESAITARPSAERKERQQYQPGAAASVAPASHAQGR